MKNSSDPVGTSNNSEIDAHWTLMETAGLIGIDELELYEMFLDGRLMPSVYFANCAPAIPIDETKRGVSIEEWDYAVPYMLNPDHVWDLWVCNTMRLARGNKFIVRKCRDLLRHGVKAEQNEPYPHIYLQRDNDLVLLLALKEKKTKGVEYADVYFNELSIKDTELAKYLPDGAVLVVRKSVLAAYKAQTQNTVISCISSIVEARRTRRPQPLQVGGTETRLNKWWRCETWTPREAALLVCGIDPDTYESTLGGAKLQHAIGLCGGAVQGDHAFAEADRIEGLLAAREHTPEKATPGEYGKWFVHNGIDTGWINSEYEMNGGAVRDYGNTFFVQSEWQKQGLFTVQEAAQAIGAQEGWHAEAINTCRLQMLRAIKDGLLTVRHPHTDLPYHPESGRDFYELVTTKGVNIWLTLCEVDYRWTSTESSLAGTDPAQPVTPPNTSAARPIPQQRAQEQEILRVIREMDHDPRAIPKSKSGAPGVKAAVRGRLTYSVLIFNKAWERLRNQGEIKDSI